MHPCQAQVCSVESTPMPDLIAIDEAVKEFGKSRRQLYNYLAQKRLRPYKIVGDRRTFLDRGQLRKVTTTGAPPV
jgi:hypothetical protein